MTAVITLSGPDNRAATGRFQLTAPVPECIRYLEGPVRYVTLPASRWVIRVAIQALLGGRFAEAKAYAHQVGVYLTAESDHLEVVDVLPLGDDGDHWVVTGTTDAHSAEEAVRAFHEWTCGETLEHSFEEEEIELRVSRQQLMRWANLNGEGDADDGSLLLLRGDWVGASRDKISDWSPLSAPFSGFLVQA